MTHTMDLNMCLLCITKSVRVLSSSEKHQTDLLLQRQLFMFLARKFLLFILKVIVT